MVTAPNTRFSQADYRRLPEGFPAQLIEGELVKDPSPTEFHQGLAFKLGTLFAGVVGVHRVLLSPIDVWIDEHNVLQPDVLLLGEADAWSSTSRDMPIPILVAEVLSPSTARRDRDVKTRIYLGAGVREVWLVDPETKTIEVRTDGGRRVVPPTGTIATPLVPGLKIVLREFFA